ncbi:MAG: hypothetical protein ABI811_15595 [Acidobacteriota bacterium]
MATETEVTLELRAIPSEMLKWSLLWIVAALLAAPAAWVTAAVARWFCGNLVFSDGTTAEFRGTGGDVVVWHVFLVSSVVAAIVFRGVFIVLAVAVIAAVAFTLLKWFVYNLRLSSGPPLTFASGRVKGPGVIVELHASWFAFLGRTAAAFLASLLIVTIPFVKLWYLRWLVQSITLRRGVDTSWDDFTQKRAPRKPSSRAVPENYGPIG